jgi:hypothetical protein
VADMVNVLSEMNGEKRKTEHLTCFGTVLGFAVPPFGSLV